MEKNSGATQRLWVLERLRKGSLTQIEAMREGGVGRLAARVHELRRAEYMITSWPVWVETRAGQSRVVRYALMSKKIDHGG